MGFCDRCWVAQLRDAPGKMTVLISSCYLLRVVKSVKFVRGVSWADNVILEGVNCEQIFCFSNLFVDEISLCDYCRE